MILSPCTLAPLVFQHPDEIRQRYIDAAGFEHTQSAPLLVSRRQLSEWRLGSPDFVHTKPLARRCGPQRAFVRFEIDPNEPTTRQGLSKRARASVLYFAEMQRNYLQAADLLHELE